MIKNLLKEKNWKLHLIVVILGLVADQITKLWAVAKFSLPDGNIDYYKVQQVIGELLQFRLVYNTGAAFGMQPQKMVGFLHPTLFFGLISIIAIVVLSVFYLKLPRQDKWTQFGVSLIASGAFGNLADRFRIHKVVDFIDVDIPDISLGSIQMDRWPTFNVADSLVCVGVAIILVLSFFQKQKSEKKENPAASPEV